MATSTIKNMFNVEDISVTKGALNAAEASVCKVSKCGRIVTVCISGNFAAISGSGELFTGLPIPRKSEYAYINTNSEKFVVAVNIRGELLKESQYSSGAGWYIGSFTYFS